MYYLYLLNKLKICFQFESHKNIRKRKISRKSFVLPVKFTKVHVRGFVNEPTIYVVLYIYSVLFLLFYIVNRKKKSFLFLPKGRALVTTYNVRNNRISDGCVYAQTRKGLGMHLVTYMNHDTVPFLLIVQ